MMNTVLTPNAKPITVTPVEFTEMPADRRVRFTVEQYEQLMRAGFLEEGAPIELLDGQLVWKDRRDRGSPGMTIGKKHVLTVVFLYNWLIEACKEHDCFPMSQQPLRLTSADSPEPDGSIVRGTFQDYLEQDIEPDDVLLVIEVADSSLDRDLGEKLRLYASADIPVYWVINLVGEEIVVLEDPDPSDGNYRQRTIYRKGESVSLKLADGTVATTPVAALIP